MIASDVFVITGALAILCVAHWRAGVAATLLFGFALDAMRKLVAGEPLYFNVLIFVLVGATLLGARLRGVPLSLKPVFAQGPALRVPLILFLLLVAIQSLAALARTAARRCRHRPRRLLRSNSGGPPRPRLCPKHRRPAQAGTLVPGRGDDHDRGHLPGTRGLRRGRCWMPSGWGWSRTLHRTPLDLASGFFRSRRSPPGTWQRAHVFLLMLFPPGGGSWPKSGQPPR